MAVVKSKVLLLMLAVLGTRAAPDSEECSRLTKTLTKADLQRVEGDWVQVWSSTANATNQTTNLDWSTLTSTYVQMRLHGDVITFKEESRFLDKSCVSFSSNLSVTSDDQQEFSVTSAMMEKDGVQTPEDDNAKIKFFKTCPSLLSMEYTGNMGRFLLLYRRDGLHRYPEVLNATSIEGQKLAECLDFPRDDLFTYDGVSEFCCKTSGSEECSSLTKAMTTAELLKVEGDWVLVWSSMENTTGMVNLTTSYVQISLHNDVIAIKEENRMSDKTFEFFYYNISVTSEDQQEFNLTSSLKEIDGVRTPEDNIAKVRFFKSCPNSLSMEYRAGTEHLLLIYKQCGDHQEPDVRKAASSEGQKLAKCLGLPGGHLSTYDGVSDFCRKKIVSEECQALTKTLTKADLTKVEGDWVLVWASMVNASEWSNLTSASVQISLHNDVIAFKEKNRMSDNTYVFYYYNTSVTSESQRGFSVLSTIVVENEAPQPESHNAEVSFYKSCDDCLSIKYNGDKSHYLLIYRRDGSPRDAEVCEAASIEGQKLAKCLDFPRYDLFTYDDSCQ